MSNDIQNNKNRYYTSVLATLTTACIIGSFVFYMKSSIFQARTETDINNIRIELNKKADASIQLELKKQLDKMDEKLDLIIMQK